LTPESAKLLAE